MDFFELQDAARRKTSVLVFYYFLAVVAIIVAVYFVVALVFGGRGGWDPGLFTTVAIGTLGVVAVGTLIRTAQLKQGGQAVAEMLGGRPVDASTRNAGERRLLNVVQEMALASGTPVPPVYLLEKEEGINAFAAGFSPGDAVIGVTRGCVEQLSREQLQGVIAHEFSHIINGDMRLNIRLIGVLAGILAIAMIGFGLMRTAAFSGAGYRHSRRREQGNLGMVLLLLGIGLIVVGYIGVFFAKVIKSAVSRQREYLADAAAVQFTRNPDGLSGALKRIGGLERGSKLIAEKAEEASHLLFANGVASFLSTIMATHPALGERIRRIDPSFSGEFDLIETPQQAGTTGPAGMAVASRPTNFVATSHAVMDSIGAPTPTHVAYAAEILKRIPDELRRVVQQPFGARAVVYGLLLDEEDNVRAHQLEHLQQQADEAVYNETLRLLPLLASAGAVSRLPLAEISLSALRQLSPSQYRDFRANVHCLMEADENISLFEYTLQHMLLRHLESAFHRKAATKKSMRSLAVLRPACVDLLSSLAHVGHSDPEQAGHAFEAGMRELFPESAPAAKMTEPSLVAIDGALDELAAAVPNLKRGVMVACIACVVADRQVTVAEAELLRAVADSLGCPVPPLLPPASG